MTKYRILLLDTKPSNPNHYICLGIFDALKNNPNVEFVFRATFGDAADAAKKNRCNLFFAFDGEGLHFELCRRLKEVCGYSILWVTEDPYELHVNLQAIDLFNRVFTNDSGSVDAYGGKGVHLPLAATQYIQYRPVQEDDSCLYDLFFAGTAWPNRVDLIRKISTLLDGKIKLKLAMPTNQYLPEIKNIPYPLSFYNWRTSNLDFSRFANHSRITLGLHRDFSATPGSPTMALTPGPRVFEVAMAGGFQLIDRSLAEIDRYFIPDQEIITFDNQQECLSKVNYFLANPQERVEIAKAAQKRALESHSYSNRIDEIFNTIQADYPLKKNALVSADAKNRPRLLFVTHNLLGRNDWGGIEVYQESLRVNLIDDYELYYLVPNNDFLVRNYELLDENLNIIETFHFKAPYMENMLGCLERERSYSTLLTKYNIQLLHIQHLLFHSPGIIFIAKALGIPVIYSWHDYYGLCKNFNLIPVSISSNRVHCDIENNSIKHCDLCLHASENILPGSQSIRREYFYRALSSVNIMHYPSKNVFRRVTKFFGPFSLEQKSIILGIPTSSALKKDLKRENQSRVQAVILGNFSHVKGANFLLELIRAMYNEPIDFHLYGRVDPLLRVQVYETVRDVKNFTYHGPYSLIKDDLFILADKDIAIFASKWPETYSIALSEVVNAGLIPIAPALGSYADRISNGVNGCLYPPGDLNALIILIKSIIQNPSILDSLGKFLKDIPVIGDIEHIRNLKILYQELLHESSQLNLKLPLQPFTSKECGILVNSNQWFKSSIENSNLLIGLDALSNSISNESNSISNEKEKVQLSRALIFIRRYGVFSSLRRLILGHDLFHGIKK